jgi:hypothetical protein
MLMPSDKRQKTNSFKKWAQKDSKVQLNTNIVLSIPPFVNHSLNFEQRAKSKVIKDRSQDSFDDNPTRGKTGGAFIVDTKTVVPFLEPQCWKVHETLKHRNIKFETRLKQSNDLVSTIVQQ